MNTNGFIDVLFDLLFMNANWIWNIELATEITGATK